MSRYFPRNFARPALKAGLAVALLAATAGASFLATTAEARETEPPHVMRSLAGSYLAGRFARGTHETDFAARFYRDALFRDPKSPELIGQSFLMEATEGNWERAEALAEQLVELDDRNRMARVLLSLSAFKSGEYDAADEQMKKADAGPIGELTSAIARGWIALARGDKKRALARLRMPRQAQWAQFYLRYHRGLIAQLSGNTDQARKSFQTVYRQDGRTLRTALVYAHHLASTGRTKSAITVLQSHLDRTRGEGHPLAVDLMKRLKSGEKVAMLINSPSEGLAELFYGLGEALAGEGGVSIGILYLQMALYLEPDHPFALAALANAHETTKRYEQAIDVYRRIPIDTPLQSAIEIRRALNLNSLDRVDEAVALLEQVAGSDPKDLRPLEALGNIMRSRKRYSEAIDYYSRAIALISDPGREHWSYFYARGTCYERIKDWPKAEKDLEKALDLYPDQPLALNYLGYSWIDQNMHLEKGLKLISKAVSLKPDDGYIVDSLGWAHYKLGNFGKAVKYLERAVELEPEDPVLNDHLGDALWSVGREREARFQWKLALSLDPEPDVLKQIEKKLAEGMTSRRQAKAVDGTTPQNPADGSGQDNASARPSGGDASGSGVPLPSRP